MELCHKQKPLIQRAYIRTSLVLLVLFLVSAQISAIRPPGPVCYLPSPCNCSCLVAWRLGLVFFLARSIFTEAFFEEKGRTPGLLTAPMYGLLCRVVSCRDMCVSPNHFSKRKAVHRGSRRAPMYGLGRSFVRSFVRPHWSGLGLIRAPFLVAESGLYCMY